MTEKQTNELLSQFRNTGISFNEVKKCAIITIQKMIEIERKYRNYAEVNILNKAIEHIGKLS